ncbi:MAG: DNA mismatch repair endonuclease MutL [Rikenellaceae bacterium]
MGSVKDKIKLLPERVANQIAAGEVVNRPASVVKEMMENAIDAGATEVIVNFRNCGRDLIQIVDNGVGMSPNDARMAFERHATSKISAAEDIYKLHTFGFRGEALASICAVAQVELHSRHRDAEVGTTTQINGGEFVDQQPLMCEFGSQFFVRNLFYNLPARRAFVEKDSTCVRNIRDEFRRVALCNPDTSFELYGDDAPIYKLQPSSLAGRIVDVVGRAIKKNLLEVHAETLIVKISGYIGRPNAAKKGTSEQFLFVNGRYFKSAYLNKAIMKGYEKIISAGYNPSYFLFLEVAPDRVDVNIHPQKTEVKFADESSVWQILNAAVRESLARTGVIPMMEFNDESSIEIPILKSGMSYAEPKAMSNREYNPFDLEYTAPIDPSKYTTDIVEYESFDIESEPKADKLREPQAATYTAADTSLYEDYKIGYEDVESASNQSHSTIEYQPIESNWSEIEIEQEPLEAIQGDLLAGGEERVAELKELSVTNGRYAWAMIGSDMCVIDLRRAKERLLYEHYLTTLKMGESTSQQILFPIELQLSKGEYISMEESAMEFSMLGFDIEYCGKELIKLNGLPSDVNPESVDILIHELLQVLSTPQSIADEIRERVARVMARNSANNLGRSISTVMAREIVEQLLKSGKMGHTPSGKAIMWQISREDIKQHLK